MYRRTHTCECRQEANERPLFKKRAMKGNNSTILFPVSCAPAMQFKKHLAQLRSCTIAASGQRNSFAKDFCKVYLHSTFDFPGLSKWPAQFCVFICKSFIYLFYCRFLLFVVIRRIVWHYFISGFVSRCFCFLVFIFFFINYAYSNSILSKDLDCIVRARLFGRKAALWMWTMNSTMQH